MEKITITETELVELQALAYYLIEHHLDIINDHVTYTIPARSNMSFLRKFGAVMGYKGKTIYEVIKTRELSQRSLGLFYGRFGSVEKRYPKNKDIEPYIARVNSFKKKLEGQITKNLPHQEASQKYNVFSCFENTQWFIFERFYNFIGRKVITFRSSANENELKVKIETHKDGMAPWAGEAFCDASQEVIIINSYNELESNSLPTNYMIRVNSKIKKIDLCVGHMTFITDRKRNVVTKTVILKKIVGEDATTAEIEMGDPDIENIIGKGIYKFLYDRRLNRLSSPNHETITNSTLLDNWHTENEEGKKELRTEKIIGKYLVYYKRDAVAKSELVKALLTIKENPNADLIANYTYEVETGKPQTWIGEVSYSAITRAAFISLKGPIRKASVENNSPIFLILNIPPGGRDFDTVTSILSGIQDRNEGALGVLAVIFRTESDDLEIEKKNKLEEFFNAASDHASIIPPKILVTTFNDLDRNISESDE